MSNVGYDLQLISYDRYDPPTLIENPSPTAAPPTTTKAVGATTNSPPGQSTVTVINGQTTIVVTPTNTQGQVSTPSNPPLQSNGETLSTPVSSGLDTTRSVSSLSDHSLAEVSAGSLTTSFSAITSTLSGSVVVTSVPVVVPVPSSSPENTVSGTTPTKRISAGAVAGAVIGGSALLILIAVLLFRLRRRALNKQSDKMEYMQGKRFCLSGLG